MLDAADINDFDFDAATDRHLWAERFDRDTGDLFTTQNEITGRIANTLNVKLATIEADRRTDEPDVLDYILRVRAAWNKGPMRDNFGSSRRKPDSNH